MADLLNIGTSGLLAFQNALTTTSHNISNVNTDGYSRQRVELDTRFPERTGAGFFGTGVDTTSVQRITDKFLTQQVRVQTSQSSRLDTFYELSSRVDNVLANPDAGLAPSLQEFFDAVHGVADNPTSQAARQVLISNAESLVDRFHSVYDRLFALHREVNTKLEGAVGEVNMLAKGIADLNKQIIQEQGKAGGQPANDLLDQRDELLRRLSEQVSVTTVAQDDGAINVFVGTGQTLVIGGTANKLAIIANNYDQSTYEIAITAANASSTSPAGPNVTRLLTGGVIGGLVGFRDQVLTPAENSLGRIAITLEQTFNEQHKLGLDLQGAQGLDFFNFIGDTANALVVPSSANLGTATGSFVISDLQQLTTSDYLLQTPDGSNFNLVRRSDNTVVGSFAGPGTYNAASEGLTITIGAGAVAGDTFEIRPTRSGGNDIQQLIFDTNRIAASAPLRIDTTLANFGTGTMTQPLADTTSTGLSALLAAGDITMVYDQTAKVFNLSGAVSGSFAYDPATTTSVSVDLGAFNAAYSGVTFDVSGVPLQGDSFTLTDNVGGVGDNGNALQLAALDTQRLLNNGTTTMQAAYGQLVSDVGSRTHQAETAATAQQVVLRGAEEAKQAVSGVNLDEEAANLIKYQQAYQAAAQTIAVAQTLFQSLLDAVRR